MKYDPLFSVEGKRVLITGSERGIGKGLARAFWERGAQVIIHGSNSQKIRSIVQDWGCEGVVANFLNSREIELMIKKIKKKFDRLDVLIHNAAMESIQPFDRLDLENFDHHMQVNLRSVLQLSHGLLPLLKKSDSPSVIHVSSIHESVACPHNSCYAMSKAAMSMLTKTLALELGPLGIRINSLAPGAVKTDMNREIVETMASKFKEWIPLGRVGQIKEMIGPAIYLASEASSYMTGATLVVDGAYSQNLVRYRPE